MNAIWSAIRALMSAFFIQKIFSSLFEWRLLKQHEVKKNYHVTWFGSNWMCFWSPVADSKTPADRSSDENRRFLQDSVNISINLLKLPFEISTLKFTCVIIRDINVLILMSSNFINLYSYFTNFINEDFIKGIIIHINSRIIWVGGSGRC